MTLKVALHTGFYLIYFFLLFSIMILRLDLWVAASFAGLIVTMHASLFYANYLWLVPQYYLGRKPLEYWLYILILTVLAVLLSRLIFESYTEFHPAPMRPPRLGRPDQPGIGGPIFHPLRFVPALFPIIIVFLLSAVLRISSHAREKEMESNMLRAERYDAELQLLKSQINPHFLFNSLNNIYSLVVAKADRAPSMLVKLSNMMRYMIYECNVDQVPLQREIEYIQNFIDLQKLKDDQMDNINFDFEEKDFHVAPMILISFVENAFKHGNVEDVEEGWIRIKLVCSDQGQLEFTVVNSKPATASNRDQGGIGLENVKKRLSLLYPDLHLLSIDNRDDSFTVKLSLLLV